MAEPDTPIERLAIVDAEERASLLQAFNATDLAPTDLLHKGQTLHGLLEHWAAASPDKTAVTFEVTAWASPRDRSHMQSRSQLPRHDPLSSPPWSDMAETPSLTSPAFRPHFSAVYLSDAERAQA